MTSTSSTIDALNQRFSCRKYDPNYVIPKETLKNIIDAVANSPSSMNSQEYDMHIVTNRKKINEIDECLFNALPDSFKQRMEGRRKETNCTNRLFYDASCLVLFLKNEGRVKFEDAVGIDIGIAAGCLMAAAQSVGLNSCTIGSAKNAAVDKALGVPDGTTMLCVVLGKGVGQTKSEKQQLKDIKWIE